MDDREGVNYRTAASIALGLLSSRTIFHQNKQQTHIIMPYNNRLQKWMAADCKWYKERKYIPIVMSGESLAIQVNTVINLFVENILR